MFKRIIKLLLTIMLLVSLYGCWDSIGIPEKNIVTVVIVDKTETGFAFYVEIPLLGGKQEDSGGGSSKQSYYLKAEGKTFTEARYNLDAKSNRPIYLGAVQSVILTQRMADYGIEEYLYRLRRTPDYRKTIKIVVTAEEPEKVLNANTENDKILGFSIEDLIQSSMNLGQIISFSLTDILEIINSPNKSFFVPVIDVINNEIHISGYAIFHDNKTIGFLPIEDSKGLIIVNSDKPIGREAIKYQDNQYTIEVRFPKRKNNVKLVNGQIEYTLDYRCKATLLYMEKYQTITQEIMDGIAIELDKYIEKLLSDGINTSQKQFECDYFKFYTYYRIKYPDQAKKTDWEKEFSNVKFNIDVKVDLKMSGNINYNPYGK